MGWGKKLIRGTEYNLTHLDAFRLAVPCGEHGHLLQVSFGAHVFTREHQQGDDPDLIFMDGKTQRTFCVDRYGHSLQLPAVIAQAIHGEAFNNGNRLVLDAVLPGLSGNYLVAFGIRPVRAKRFEGRLHIRSAYRRDRMPANMRRAKFPVVVHNALVGQNTRWKR